jgi:hypothetical protein
VSRALALALLVAPSLAHAGAWTRDAGHFYINTSYSRIAASSVFDANFDVVHTKPYEQHVWGLYGEIGVIDRWLTATVEGTLYRRNEIVDQGHTEGMGDWRVGVWSGLVTKPLRLAIGTTLGIPVGDPYPSAGRTADSGAQQIARSLPTGDGEWDVEWRAALGYSFGGVRRWPLEHFLIVEAGYWLRTHGFSDAFVYRLTLGIKFPWRFVERFWVQLSIRGVESFASAAEASRDATGLGNGVSFLAPGLELYGRIYRGLGASIGADTAVRARSVAAGAQLKVAISYDW